MRRAAREMRWSRATPGTAFRPHWYGADGRMLGLVLADLARHVAAAFAESSGWDAQQALAKIHEAWEAEWSHPTDVPTR